jgi:hypothetical protein
VSSTATYLSAGNNCFTNSSYDQPVYGNNAATQQMSNGIDKRNVLYTMSHMNVNTVHGSSMCTTTELNGSQQLSPGYGQLAPDLMQGQGHVMSPDYRQQQQQVNNAHLSPTHCQGQQLMADHSSNQQSMFTDDMIRRELLTGNVNNANGRVRPSDCTSAYLFTGSSTTNGQPLLGYQVNGSTNSVSSNNNTLVNGQPRTVLDSLNAMFVNHLH